MTISEFRNNMGVALKQLPVELWDSKSKKVVGVVSLGGFEKGADSVRVVEGKEVGTKYKKPKEQTSVGAGLCKHGKFGYCVEGCFK